MKSFRKKISGFGFFLAEKCRAFRFITMFILAVFWCRSATGQGGCDMEAMFTVGVDGGNIVCQASMPDPSMTYTWDWTGIYGSGSGTGTSLAIPVDFTLDEYYQVTLHATNDFGDFSCLWNVNWNDACSRADFTPTVDGCLTSFVVEPYYANTPGFSHYWQFGDNTHGEGASATHLYGQTGTYNVCHVAIHQTQDDVYSLNYCCKNIETMCEPGGGIDPEFGTSLPGDCCMFLACFTGDNPPGSVHSWDFGDGTTSDQPPPLCHTYSNLSTYQTPTVVVEHCITVAGSVFCTQQVTSLTNPSYPPAIYAGVQGQQTSLTNVVSTIDGQPLFPNDLLQGPGPDSEPLRVHIAGELVMDKTFTFMGQVNFCMNPFAGMRVKKLKTLTFDDRVWVNNRDGCCMWRSIDLESVSNFTSKNDNIIESARHGIRTAGANPVLRISGTFFRDNFVGIYAKDPVVLARFDRNRFSTSYPLDALCQLTGLPLPVPFTQLQGFAGIVAHNTTFNIPNPVGATSLDDNEFWGMANGIWLENSNAEIRRCYFHNIGNNVYSTPWGGNGIRARDITGGHSLLQWGATDANSPTTFEKVADAITVFSAQGTGNTFVQSQGNTMHLVRNGYMLDIGGNLMAGSFVRSNSMDCSNRGISLQQELDNITHLLISGNEMWVGPGADAKGIELVSYGFPALHDVRVLDNEVHLLDGFAGIHANVFRGAVMQGNHVFLDNVQGGLPLGILLEGGRQNTVNCSNQVTGGFLSTPGTAHGIVTDASTDNLISDNIVESTTVGIQFRNPPVLGTTLQCNSMETHEVGLDYWPLAATGDQGPNGASRGNKWLGTWPSWAIGARHQGIFSAPISNSQYFAKANSNQWPPNISVINIPNSSWFVNNNSYLTCTPNCLMSDTPMDTLTQTDTAIVLLGGLYPQTEEAFNWETIRYLYKRLVESPNMLTNNGMMQGFKYGEDGSSVGMLCNTASHTKTLMEMDSATLEAWEENFTNIQHYLSEIRTIDSILIAGNMADTVLLATRQAWEDSIGVSNQSNESIKAQWLLYMTTNSGPVVAYNSAISTLGAWDGNEKTLQDIFLNSVAQGLPLTLAQKAQVLNIAAQCPQVGGNSTYWARAWYYMLTGKAIVPQGCEEIDERSFKGQDSAPQLADANLVLAPNPANDFVEVRYALPSDWGAARLMVSDALGRPVTILDLDPALPSLTLHLENMPKGIYFLHIEGSGKKTPVQKLIIL